jgi:hypothetical protein
MISRSPYSLELASTTNPTRSQVHIWQRYLREHFLRSDTKWKKPLGPVKPNNFENHVVRTGSISSESEVPRKQLRYLKRVKEFGWVSTVLLRYCWLLSFQIWIPPRFEFLWDWIPSWTQNGYGRHPNKWNFNFRFVNPSVAACHTLPENGLDFWFVVGWSDSMTLFWPRSFHLELRSLLLHHHLNLNK